MQRGPAIIGENMSFSIRHIGDAEGDGHELTVTLMDRGTIVLASHNPDTGETQRIVLLREQWKMLLEIVLEHYGTRNCRFQMPDGACRADPDTPPLTSPSR